MRYLPLLIMCAAIGLAGIAFHTRLRPLLQNFWNATGSPFNLALFRIVLFTTFFASVDVSATVWYSQLPPGLRIAPFGLEKILAYVPIGPSIARVSAILLLLACGLAAAGLFTRVTAWLTVPLGLYVLCLPHLYGKVNHLHHHLIWFAALMAASPCADVLSCDAIALARRRADAGITAPPPDGRRYALPLRFVWLLLGVIYFFPGFWKLLSVGLPWMLPENMRLQMYSKWLELDGWTPAFRIDQHPALCALAGAGTVLFEVSFPILIFFPKARLCLVPLGLAFHNLTNLFMRIAFYPLQAMYISLVDWAALFRWLSRWISPDGFCLAGEGGSLTRRRLIAAIRAFDIFDCIRPAKAAASPEESRFELRPCAEDASRNGRRYCHAIITIGTFLLVTNIGFGLRHVSEAWPFACFPTFAFRAGPARSVTTVVVQDASGRTNELRWNSLNEHFGPDHARGLQEALLRMKDARTQHRHLEALWKLWRQSHPELGGARTISFYKDTLRTIPEEQHLLKRELLYTIPGDD